MTTTRITERHIVQQLLHRRRCPRRAALAEPLIGGLALAAGTALLLVLVPGLLWLALAAALLVALGLR